MDENLLIRLKSYYFNLIEYAPLEKAIEFHLYAYMELSELLEEERFIISLFFLNYCLIVCNIPCIRLLLNELKEYENNKKKYFSGDKKAMYFFY